jgi:3-phosphoshikimate 1-carboxyvinyltransferase
MIEKITPARSVSGSVRLPGDKSISHRWAMLAALAEGESTLNHYSSGADCHSTLGVLRSLGADISVDGTTVTVKGKGLDGLQAYDGVLDAGNSGSTIRMMAGILAGQPFTSRITGDESLVKRPMKRVMAPLSLMGAHIEATNEQYPPLTIHGAKLKAIDYTPPMASAQVKTCVLFAGMFCEGETLVRESVRTRDHSELALAEFGAEIETKQRTVKLQGRPKLVGRTMNVPGDLSSAAFFLAAALMVEESNLVIGGVGLNPSRTALLEYLASIGADVKVLNLGQDSGELQGEILVRGRPKQAGEISGALAAALIDEIPVLAVLGAATTGLVVKDAAELRVKETDRIATVSDNLKRMGCEVTSTEDGMIIPGGQKFRAAQCDSHGDHRIAMAFSVAALAADGPCEIHHAEAASVSFPEFYETLRRITA